MHIPDYLVGPLYAATVGAAFTFVGSVLTKEQKTSEFRQAWIDALRTDLADYLSKTEEFARQIQKKQKERTGNDALQERTHDEMLFAAERRERDAAIRTLEARILLRLNPQKHQVLIQRIQRLTIDLLTGIDYEERFTPTNTDTLSTYPAESSIHFLVSASREVLKKEWERVKRGEPIYVVTKWVSIALVAVFLVVGALNAFQEPQPSATTVRGSIALSPAR